jgi:hypothetical protein
MTDVQVQQENFDEKIHYMISRPDFCIYNRNFHGFLVSLYTSNKSACRSFFLNIHTMVRVHFKSKTSSATKSEQMCLISRIKESEIPQTGHKLWVNVKAHNRSVGCQADVYH